MFCTNCGEVRRTRYVACSKGRRGLDCHFLQWNYDDLENLVLAFCQSVDYATVMGDKPNSEVEVNNARLRLTSLDNSIKERQASLDNLLHALESAGTDEAPAILLKRLSSLETEINDLLAAA